MVRAELFKTFLYLQYIEKSKDKFEAERFINKLFNEKDLIQVIKPFFEEDATILFNDSCYEFFMVYYIDKLHTPHGLSFKEAVPVYLSEKVEIKTNKDYYFKALFNELFYFVDFFRSNIQKLIIEFTESIARVISRNKDLEIPNRRDFTHNPEDLLFLVNTNDKDIIYRCLRSLCFSILDQQFKVYNFNILPKCSCLYSIKSMISHSLQNNNYKEFADFFDEPFDKKTLLYNKILNVNLSEIKENILI